MKKKLHSNDVINDFGLEWEKFDQVKLSENEKNEIFSSYFKIFPWNRLALKPIGIDVGSGSGRWASLVAPKVDTLYCCEPSKKAIEVARANLKFVQNIEFFNGSVFELQKLKIKFDFAYSLGVLHHIDDTQGALNVISSVLNKGAPFLIYLYYSFDNKPAWYRLLWKFSDVIRDSVSNLPFFIKNIICDLLALFLYLPTARLGLVLKKLGFNVENWPLIYYADRSFYCMRTDSLDRFGTKLEKRYSKEDIKSMMGKAGFINIEFSDEKPFWCAIGYKG